MTEYWFLLSFLDNATDDTAVHRFLQLEEGGTVSTFIGREMHTHNVRGTNDPAERDNDRQVSPLVTA